MEQDDDGTLFLGTYARLMRFDGSTWNYVHAPVGDMIISMKKSSDGIVYLGGQGLMGYIAADSLSRFTIRSLNSHIDLPYSEIGTVWDVVEFENSIYFRTQERIFVWNGEDMDILDSENSFSHIQKVGDRLLIGLSGKGLAWLREGEMVHVPGSERYAEDKIRFIIETGSDYLIGSRGNGLVTFDGTSFAPLRSEVNDRLSQAYKAVKIDDRHIAIGGIGESGVMIISPEGKLITTLTEADGLVTNTVYDLFVDGESALWVIGLEGVSRVMYGNPLTKIDRRRGLDGAVLNIIRQNNRLYLGTTSGLYYMRHSAEGFEIQGVNEIRGQLNGLATVGNQLIAASGSGLYILEKGTVDLVREGQFRSLLQDQNNPESVHTLTRNEVFSLENSSPVRKFEVPSDITEGLYHQGHFWLLTPQEGVLRYHPDGRLIQQYRVNMEEREQYRHIGLIGSELYLGTDSGLYTYGEDSLAFVPDTIFGNQLGNLQVNYFTACAEDEIWFRSNRKIQKFTRNPSGDEWSKSEDPYNLIDDGESIETIHCGTDGDLWFGGNNALYHLSDSEWEYSHDFNTNISGLLIHNDSLIYGGYGDLSAGVTLPFGDNQFRFTYAAASYVAPDENMYRTRLRGYDNDWSNWTPETQKDYTYVPEGRYVFEVQGRNVFNREAGIASFPIRILPPWYRTIWAYMGYLLMVGGILYGLHRIRINRIVKEQRIRNRIASDLHDEVSATLSSISYFAQAIRQTTNGQAPGRFVDLISESAADAKEKITDIIWSVDPENDSWVNLLSKCRRFASDLLESKGIAYDLEIATDIPRPLPLETRQHLWLIFKEMVTNAARHSGASEVRIRFGYENGSVKLVIQDNGSGWDTETAVKGNGIRNIRRRASLLDGRLDLESDGSVGTRWTMELEC